MRAFAFPLRRVLEWRRTQLELEENKLRHLAASLEEMALAAVRLDLVKSRAEVAVRQAAVVEAGDLWALAAYRQRLMAELQALAERRVACEQQVAAQRQKVLEAQRQCRLLEKLEHCRHAEWRRAADREMEGLAAESFLARWNRPAD
jgi:flagellar biosynthesis chaperone FliJ